MYSSFNYAVEELVFPELGLDRMIDTHEISPVFAAALTGALYKATSALHMRMRPTHTHTHTQHTHTHTHTHLIKPPHVGGTLSHQ